MSLEQIAELDSHSPGAGLEPVTEAEERISVAPQWQLMWWRFRKHKLALVSTVLVVLFYLVVAFADFLAYADPLASEAQRALISPQVVHLFGTDGFAPYVEGLAGARDPQTFKRVYVPDPNTKVQLALLPRGFSYKLFG